MRTIETTFETFGASVLLLGFKGDSNATEILIDCEDALEEYQGTMAALSITGPDLTVYPGDISLDEDGVVHWVVAARDCGIAGHGSVRIDLVDDAETVVASAEASTIIMKTNMKNIAPDQIADWTEAASVALQELKNALLDLYDGEDTTNVSEAARRLAETGRVNAELLRVSAESARVTAESARVTAENARATAETARATAETARATAETARGTAETARASAETARVSEFSTIEANAQAALSYIGPSEDSSTASAAHAEGSYFIYDGKLYKATADIAIGDTITSGTNCAQVTGGAMGEISDLISVLEDDFYYMVGDTSNLLNGVTYTEGYYIGDDGTISESSDFHYTSLIPIKGNTKYTLIWYRPVYNTGYIRVHNYDANGTRISPYLYKTNDGTAGKHVAQFTTSANASYIRISAKKDGLMNLMILTSDSVIDIISNTNKAINAIAHCTNILPLMGKETTVASVQRTYKNGHISQSGTASSKIQGGRYYPITDNFELDSGTYYLWCYPDAIGTYLLCKANGDAVGYSNGTAITVEDQGEYYIAYSGYIKDTVYSESTYIQLEKNAKTDFHLPSDTFGIDLKAREGVATNEQGIIILNDYIDSFLSTYRIILGEVASNTGAINSSELSYARRTGLIKTKPGDVWSYYGRGDYQIAAAAYYADGTFVSYESTAHSVERKTFTIPSGCNGVIFSSYNTADFDVVPKSPMTSVNTDRLYIPNWSSKKWCAIGDSITAKYGSPYADEKQYWAYIKEETGINFINCATSGMGYKNGEDEQHLNAFYQKASVERYPDLADADIITVFGSVNDCAWGYTLGDVTDNTTDTVCGCINKTIDNLYVCNYAAVIGIITPGPTTNRYPSKANEYMTDYCEKIVEICNRRSIPCLDLYHNSGCHPWDETFKEEMYINDGDGIHPNGKGHKIIYPRIRDFMKTLI